MGKAPRDWACTRDNLTGLIWEVKTSDRSDIRYGGHQYGWYDTNSQVNGGNAGNVNSPACFPTLPLCNTQAFIDTVNRSRLCSYSDWFSAASGSVRIHALECRARRCTLEFLP